MARKPPPEKLKTLTSIIQSRSELLSRLGQTYNGNRNIFTACGYKTDIAITDYVNKYERLGLATRVINAYPDATWRTPPDVYETDDETETPFEKAWQQLVKTRRIFHYITRLDRLVGIGQYAVLLMGVDDGKTLSQPLVPKKNLRLIYLQPFGEVDAVIKSFDTDTTSERYGLPVLYQLTVRNTTTGVPAGQQPQGTPIDVHYTRVLHIAENCLSSDVYGTPRLKGVFNDLDNLEKVLGGSSEGFWQGVFGGMAFEMDKDVSLTTADEAALTDEIDAYVHQYQRYLRLKGITAKPLNTSSQDPQGVTNVLVQMISSGTGIPQRILTGSEMGELASTQDRENWNSRVDERRKSFAEPFILRALIDALIEAGILPPPKEQDKDSDSYVYKIDWPDMAELSPMENANMKKVQVDMVSSYVNGGVDAMLPPQWFLEEFLGLDTDTATKVLDDAEQRLTEIEEENIASGMGMGQEYPPDTSQEGSGTPQDELQVPDQGNL